MRITAHYNFVGIVWLALLAIWLVGAVITNLSGRQDQKKMGIWGRVLYIAAIIGLYFGMYFLFGGLRHANIIPAHRLSEKLVYPGYVLLVGGFIMAVSARVTLGNLWSGMPTVKTGHKVIRSGVYGWVRHPIYTGLLAMLLGTALVFGAWFMLLFFAAVVIILWWKAKSEEKLLTQSLGTEYEDYRQEVPMLLPWPRPKRKDRAGEP